jgi:hypothetical protein
MAVEGLVDLAAPSGREGSENWGALIRPDVLDRGIMTVKDVENEFDM